MSKERLEEIKGRYMEFEYDFNLRKEDIEWLIEQTDRGVEYDRYLISLEDNKHYVTGLEQQNKRYREAIRECIERMNEGGAGTRSFVYERLIEVLEGNNDA